MADPDEALIEAIADRVRHDLKTRTIPPDPITGIGGMGLTEYDIARAAYAALVAHLGLVEETLPPGYWFEGSKPTRRLMSRWTEVDHGSE